MHVLVDHGLTATHERRPGVEGRLGEPRAGKLAEGFRAV